MKIKNLSGDDLLHWLQLCRSIGEVSFYSMLYLYKNPENALAQLSILQQRSKKAVRSFSRNDALKELELVKKFGADCIASCDNRYSDALRLLRDAPPLLTVKGNIDLLKRPSIAIVGSRNASINSCNFAYSLASELAKNEYTIVSGLAVGIDTAALKILNNDLPVIAVIGTGIDRYYPVENRELQDKIINNGGLVVTEVPFGRRGQSMHFARRNRIISGLSEAVIVVEASENSGSLITAQHALEQGKYLFAAPGAPYDKRFAGSNGLLKRGATLIESASDVMQSLEGRKHDNFDHTLFDVGEKEFIPFTDLKYNTNEIGCIKTKILEKLDNTPIPITHLAHSLNLPDRDVLLAIIELEIERKITRTTAGEALLLYQQTV